DAESDRHPPRCGRRPRDSRRAPSSLREGAAPRAEARPRDAPGRQHDRARSALRAARALASTRSARVRLMVRDAMPPAADRQRRAATLLRDRRVARIPIGPLPADCRPRDELEAYAVQEALHGLLAGSALGPVTGHKIGCTTPVMQKFLGINNPC